MTVHHLQNIQRQQVAGKISEEFLNILKNSILLSSKANKEKSLKLDFNTWTISLQIFLLLFQLPYLQIHQSLINSRLVSTSAQRKYPVT